MKKVSKKKYKKLKKRIKFLQRLMRYSSIGITLYLIFLTVISVNACTKKPDEFDNYYVTLSKPYNKTIFSSQDF